MLRKVKELHGDALRALDGELGSVDEILFDDEQWGVRYLIVDTGSWLLGRKVLIAPAALGALDWDRHELNVNLTRDQVRRSPGVETNAPVSRQLESDYYDYYAMPYYWGGPVAATGIGMSGGMGLYQASLLKPIAGDIGIQEATKSRELDRTHGDTHLRSTKEVSGYGIYARDGHIGHVADFIVDDETWRIRYLAIDTQDWWPGKKVLLSPDRIGQVIWPDRRVTVDLTRSQVQDAPQWDSHAPISADFEAELSTYYAGQQANSRIASLV